jgi:preprotein translocase subunit SecG
MRMLIGFLKTLLVFDGILLIFIVLLQKGKGGVGLAGMGGGAQMLFGGSGGQDLFQKITWFLGAFFMAGSLLLALMKSDSSADLANMIPAVNRQAPMQAGQKSVAGQQEQPVPAEQPAEAPAPTMPVE